MSVKKNINYMGRDFVVEYLVKQAKDMNGTWHHNLSLIKVDGESIPIYEYSWIDSYKKRENIIGNTRILLNKYFESITKKDFTYYDEFMNWDGNLNNWDE